MKKYLLLSLMTLTCILALGASDPGVHGSNVTVNAGQTATVPIDLNNLNYSFVSFQMDLTIPDGVTINKDGCSLTSRVTGPDKELVIGKQSDNVYRLTFTSFSLTPISGSSGALINLSLSASAESNGGQATLTNIRFVTANSERITMNDDYFTITVVKPSATVATAPTAKTLSYTGSAQQLVYAGVASGGTMQYSIDGTTYGNSIPMGTNAGSYTVYYKVMGDARHSDTNPASVSVTINTKNASNLTISDIDALSYTGLAQTPALTVKDGTTFLTNGMDYTASYSNNTNVGTATVTITGMGNYSETQTANFTIKKAPLTISGGTYTMKQGEELPTFTATYDGFKNEETEDVLTTKPTLTTEATSASEPGDYEVTVSGAEAQNYEITYVPGTLTIEEPDVLLGDVNNDGKVNIGDVVAVVNVMAGKTTGYNLKAADANQDGKINIGDVVKIVNIIAGKV